jgi:hypothetical protein
MPAGVDDIELLARHRSSLEKRKRDFSIGGGTMEQQEMEGMEEQFAAAAEFDRNDEEALVHEWRASQLERLGISRLVAEAFASFVDWHDVARLVERGCSCELAIEIVR